MKLKSRLAGSLQRLLLWILGHRERRQMQVILGGMAAVHADNASRMVADQGGDMPKCKPKLGTHYCERCGRDVTTNNARSSACPSIPPERRWKMTYPPHCPRNDPAMARRAGDRNQIDG